MDFFYAIYNLLLSHVIQVFNLYGLDVIHAYSFDVYLINCAIFWLSHFVLHVFSTSFSCFYDETFTFRFVILISFK